MVCTKVASCLSFGEQRYSRSSPPPPTPPPVPPPRALIEWFRTGLRHAAPVTLSDWVIIGGLSDQGPEQLQRNAAHNSGPAPDPLLQLQTLKSSPSSPLRPPSPPVPSSMRLRPISQQDPWGHFQKQSLSLSSQEVPGLIINKLLMFWQRIAQDCASAVDVWVHMHACVLAVRGHSKVLLDRAVQVVRLIELTSEWERRSRKWLWGRRESAPLETEN